MSSQAKDYSAGTQKLLNNRGALCNMVRRIALQAGEITLDYFEDAGLGGDVDTKSDGSPVTKADQDAEAYIRAELEKLTPDILFVGEEMASMGERPDLTQEQHFWIVDPLDGTKEFVSGSGDYTVNIALIENSEPVLGVVYAPAKGELYLAHGPDTAKRWLEDTDKEKPITVRPIPHKGLTVVASASHGDTDRLDRFLDNFKVDKKTKRGSSLKICMVAAGKADLYPRFGPTCEWDTAAADAILRAAGGFMTDSDGNPLVYGGRDPKFLNPEFIASSFPWFELKDDEFVL